MPRAADPEPLRLSARPDPREPSTRKALSTFAEVAAIGLVDFHDDYERRLGITATSKAQSDAVIAHLRETMREEAPQLLCFEPPKNARKIDMNAKKEGPRSPAGARRRSLG